jgi:hypothetical protein
MLPSYSSSSYNFWLTFIYLGSHISYSTNLIPHLCIEPTLPGVPTSSVYFKKYLTNQNLFSLVMLLLLQLNGFKTKVCKMRIPYEKHEKSRLFKVIRLCMDCPEPQYSESCKKWVAKMFYFNSMYTECESNRHELTQNKVGKNNDTYRIL